MAQARQPKTGGRGGDWGGGGQALIGEGPSAERPPPPHCPGQPHDCAERPHDGAGAAAGGGVPPTPPHHLTALSPISVVLSRPDTAEPLCMSIGRGVFGDEGASGCTSPLQLPAPDAEVTRCYVPPRHLHATPSALHALVPFPRVLLKGGGGGCRGHPPSGDPELSGGLVFTQNGSQQE